MKCAFAIAAILGTACPAAAQECNWQEMHPANFPTGSATGGLAYDSVRGFSVLLTGVQDKQQSQTWEWNGGEWTLRFNGGPLRRSYHASAFDSKRGVTVIFGGLVNGLDDANDTWEWNGESWLNPLPNVAPETREAHCMVFDSKRGVTVLFGGYYMDYWGEHEETYGDTWEWDGRDWAFRSNAGPGPSHSNAMAFDSTRGVTVLYGGSGHRSTWEWDGKTWAYRTEQGPGERSNAAMVFDSRQRKCILFGGASMNSVLDDTWAWDGEQWSELSFGDRPFGRRGHAMAYDSARNSTVLFGGDHLNGFYDDTWEFSCTVPCYADLDQSGSLDLFDFLAFVNLFNAGDDAADCDASQALDLFDFLCFTNAFNAGCP